MKALIAVLLGGLAVACAAPPAPTPGPSPSIFEIPSRSASASVPSPSPSALTDSIGNILFSRPADWQEERPTVAVFPGPLLWLSSEPLASACAPIPPQFPIGCLPGAVLPDGGVLIEFGSGATLILSAATPIPIRDVQSDACTAAGGHAVSTRLAVTYIDACLRGRRADAAFDAFYRSLRLRG